MKKKGKIRSSAQRRPPSPRFPFIISAHHRSEDTLNDLPRVLKNILEENTENGVKTSKLLKKMVFVESALDELLESNQIEGAAGDHTDAEIRSFFFELIPVLDNLDRLKQAVTETGQEEWIRGVDIFHEKLTDLLSTHGFYPSAETGMTFNPERHESVSVEYNAHLPSGTISEIIASGWLYKDSVLRYAKVTVTKDKD